MKILFFKGKKKSIEDVNKVVVKEIKIDGKERERRIIKDWNREKLVEMDIWGVGKNIG